MNENYWKLAAIALLVGILMSLPILRLDRPTVMQALVLSAAANGVGAWAATVFAYWTGHYFVFGSAFALTLGLILLVPLVLIAMARIDEIAAIAFGRGPRRLITKSAPLAPATIGENVTFPKVSIHIPAYFEPVEMLKQTLDAVSRLDYPNFECVVHHQQHARSGILAADPGSLPRARRALQVHQRREGRRASRPARCASPWTAPRPTPRSSASSTPTMSCIRTG